MPDTTNPPPILIIGAGLAGLSLGQALKQANIPFRIFERDTSASFRAQGYRIRVGSDGAGALQQLLPPELFAAFEATCADVVHGGSAVDALTGGPLKFHVPGGGAMRVRGGRVYNADRAVLRRVLLSGLEGSVEFGRKLEGFEVLGDGDVVARFTDGRSARGGLLIGADGVRSVVRHQLLPGFKVLDTEGRAVFGKTLLSEGLTRQLPEKIGHGISIAYEQGESRMKLFTDGMRFDYSRAAQFDKGLNIEMPESYVYWVLVLRKDVVDDDDETLLSFSSEQSVQKSLDLTSSWHESLRVLMTGQVPDATSTLAFLTSIPSFGEDWAGKPAETRSCVTLVGDAAHPMPPVGGLGANASFQDAADLFVKLRDGASGDGHEKTIIAYEEDMLKRAQPFVQMSSGAAGHFFGMKPLEELKPAVLWR